MVSKDASDQSTIRTMSLSEYTSAKYGLLINVRNEAIKLVDIEAVLQMMFGVSNAHSIR